MQWLRMTCIRLYKAYWLYKSRLTHQKVFQMNNFRMADFQRRQIAPTPKRNHRLCCTYCLPLHSHVYTVTCWQKSCQRKFSKISDKIFRFFLWNFKSDFLTDEMSLGWCEMIFEWSHRDLVKLIDPIRKITKSAFSKGKCCSGNNHVQNSHRLWLIVFII